jgi:23S rRNA (cytosine1962-C5)-methyltransferase
VIHTLSPVWNDYELIDIGNFEKLERFGKYIVARPEPQAVWQKSLSEKEWKQLAQAYFKKETENAENGKWQLSPAMPESWWIQFPMDKTMLKMRLALTSFKHVGVFPEQAENWKFIYQAVKAQTSPQPKVLNLFAYTGGASLAAKAAGADVVHVDSVKVVISWARENMEASGLKDIRWVVEDALKFVKNEVKRGKTYDGIILDPPAYGRGANGEKWLLEKQIDELLQECALLLKKAPEPFLVMNFYAIGFSALVSESLLKKHFPHQKKYEIGELYIPDRQGIKLPLGTYGRFGV